MAETVVKADSESEVSTNLWFPPLLYLRYFPCSRKRKKKKKCMLCFASCQSQLCPSFHGNDFLVLSKNLPCCIHTLFHIQEPCWVFLHFEVALVLAPV